MLCKDNPTKEEIAVVDIIQNVDENTVPTFMMHTSNDPVVNVTNSLDMGQKLKSLNKEFELHIYPDGPHGVALSNELTGGSFGNCEKWVIDASFWAKNIK